mmetsp:Transcript_1778/g.2520  ORF Transcript_1778/g.2520 Transcript_1778/m.2520 type:complete len:142 (+) Transcript_1778:286-711(+)|eukprot:CAMPEP_0185581758 /NCGR_PEP_ID=MMETSP0434-20130131/18895_1 /TAXON_ID=626734 ORGANISM="Favella taraikaensis, Strain Fe Narragansett Bay" /NCGR_SAMPLE_ID=MMETSP0434 /ASSEMBLY_ACC=CAM_ASM_000379 /LENGTH=141 /DNA_ID=CAMNT_0028200375 /DNA_START=266 /DNA_END=691 /DNA_ORIENTATION=-
MATNRCEYKTTCIRKGGCDELFCPRHAHAPKDPEKRVCCIDCANQYDQDTKRRRVFVIVGIIVAVVVLIFGIALIAAAANRRSKRGGSQWNKTLKLSVEPKPLFDPDFDQNAQAYSTVLVLLDAQNSERRLLNRGDLIWED